MPNYILRVEGVTKKFGGVTALNNVSLYVNEGEIVGLMGPNGAGKTTLFNVVTGYIKVDAGRIYFKEKEITNLDPHETTRLGIARTFQIPQPFSSLTVYQNMLVAAMHGRGLKKIEAHQKVREVLKEVGLYDKQDFLPNGLNIVELRRLELARALCTSPSIILIDEAGAGLTEKEVPELVEIIKKIHESGTTVIIIEHVLDILIQLSNRVIVLNNGQIIAEGVPHEVMKDIEVIKSYLGTERIMTGQ